jgi:hypothetical protein
MPNELTKLADRPWCDPALCQVTSTQPVGELGGVALVVLHPPGVPVQSERQSERVNEMDLRAFGFQEVCRPLPAIGGLERHF